MLFVVANTNRPVTHCHFQNLTFFTFPSELSNLESIRRTSGATFMQSTMLPAIFSFFSAVVALNPVLVQDNVFYDSVTKERFFLKGIDYQPLGEQGIDPLVDPEQCARDLFLIQQLGANVVRYDFRSFIMQPPADCSGSTPSIIPRTTMSACQCTTLEVLYDDRVPSFMQTLTRTGIYLILDVNSGKPNQHLNRLEPWTTYTKAYAEHVFKTIAVFSGYDNGPLCNLR